MKIAANGNIAAWQEAIVGTEANGLRLAEVRVNVGDVVKRGQVLATFAPDMMQADVAQIRAVRGRGRGRAGRGRRSTPSARASCRPAARLSEQQINQYMTAERTAQARLDAQRAQCQRAAAAAAPDRRCWRPTTASSRRAAPPSARCCRPGRSCSA